MLSRNRDTRRKTRTLLGDYSEYVPSSGSKEPLTNDVFPVIWLHKLAAETIQSLLQAVVPDRSTFKFRLHICDRTRSLLETNWRFHGPSHLCSVISSPGITPVVSRFRNVRFSIRRYCNARRRSCTLASFWILDWYSKCARVHRFTIGEGRNGYLCRIANDLSVAHGGRDVTLYC